MNQQGLEVMTQLMTLALALIMLGLGLSMTIEDFRRVLRFPLAVSIGLTTQVLILPAFAFALCKLFHLTPEYSVGLMLLAASPGGMTATLFSHFAKGDVALNLTLTALNSILSAVTLPLILAFAFAHFMGGEQAVGPQFSKAIQVFTVIFVPVSIGMWIKSRWPKFAKRMDRPTKVFSSLVLVVIVIGALNREWTNIVAHIGTLGPSVFIFNCICLAVGYGIPLALKLPVPQARAIAFELGVHNATLAITLAITVLHSYMLAIPSAIYGVLMYFTASAMLFLLKLRDRK